MFNILPIDPEKIAGLLDLAERSTAALERIAVALEVQNYDRQQSRKG